MLATVSCPLFQAVRKEDTKMNTNQCDIGLIGLAVMGENLALNLESKGFSVAVFNRTTEVTEKFAAGRAKGKNIQPTRTMEEFVAALKKPRIAMMMIKAGKPVDIVISRNRAVTRKRRRADRRRKFSFHRHATARQGIRGERNSFCRDGRFGRRRRRAQRAFADAGWFARVLGNHRAHFPQDRCAGRWRTVLPIHGPGWRRSLRQDGPQRHRVRRHSIDLRSLCNPQRYPGDAGSAACRDVFAEWNKGELDSYLIEITSQIFRKIDPETGKPLVDMILDKAGQKGTGIWTLQAAIRQSVVISTINAAVEARVVSAQKEERVAASKILPQPRVRKFKGNRPRFVDAVRDALYASKIVSYAQGMELLRSGSTEYKWNLNLSDIATIWRGGCIIRAKFLNRIVEAYQRDAALHNLLLDEYFTRIIKKAQRNWRVAVSTAIKHGVAVPAFSASLAYFDSYRSAAVAGKSLAGTTRFLRRAHLRAHR